MNLSQPIQILTEEQVRTAWAKQQHPGQASYFAMFNSWLGGIVTDPSMMTVPVDDHIVHRGDGVFEAIKVVGNKIFLLQDHLERLAVSADKLALKLPYTLEEIAKIIRQTLAVTPKERSRLIRLFVSRGPGGFTTNPYECVGAQLYIVITELKPLPEEKYETGVKVGRSVVTVKDPWMATTKSCNYLTNVMMKKESVDRKLDFTVGFDGEGFLAESSTENIVFVDKEGYLVRPLLRQILKGTTMIRAFELAKKLVADGTLKGIIERNLTEKELIEAKEVMMIGTTLDVMPVTSYEGQPVADGKVGVVAKTLRQLIVKDIQDGERSVPA